MKYIDADRLKEQIQGLINLGYDKLQGNLYHVLNIITSLQQEQSENNIPSAGSGAWGTTPPKFKLNVKPVVPEVDLEKEFDKFYRVYRDKTGKTYDIEDNEPCFDWKEDELAKHEIHIARHFYELGLNARKEN